MLLTKPKSAVFLAAGLALVALGFVAQPSRADKPAAPAQSAARAAEKAVPEISPAQFAKLRELIRPKPGGFDDVRWLTDLWEARKKAAAEGKPILIWVGDGHPLGWT